MPMCESVFLHVKYAALYVFLRVSVFRIVRFGGPFWLERLSIYAYTIRILYFVYSTYFVYAHPYQYVLALAWLMCALRALRASQADLQQPDVQ